MQLPSHQPVRSPAYTENSTRPLVVRLRPAQAAAALPDSRLDWAGAQSGAAQFPACRPLQRLDRPVLDRQARPVGCRTAGLQLPRRHPDLQPERDPILLLRTWPRPTSRALSQAPAYLPAQPLHRPPVLLGLAKPEILLRLRQRGHLSVMAETQRVPPTRQREPPGHPRIIPQRLRHSAWSACRSSRG